MQLISQFKVETLLIPVFHTSELSRSPPYVSKPPRGALFQCAWSEKFA
jgi:hypothetical protein